MNPNPDPAVLLKQLVGACRIGFLVVAAIIACVAIGAALSIDIFEPLIRSMLCGRPIPGATQLVFSFKSGFKILSFGLPALAVFFAWRVRRVDRAVLGISLCSIGLLLVSVLIVFGLVQPMLTVANLLQLLG
jgi:hypothetical protein